MIYSWFTIIPNQVEGQNKVDHSKLFHAAKTKCVTRSWIKSKTEERVSKNASAILNAKSCIAKVANWWEAKSRIL